MLEVLIEGLRDKQAERAAMRLADWLDCDNDGCTSAVKQLRIAGLPVQAMVLSAGPAEEYPSAATRYEGCEAHIIQGLLHLLDLGKVSDTMWGQQLMGHCVSIMQREREASSKFEGLPNKRIYETCKAASNVASAKEIKKIKGGDVKAPATTKAKKKREYTTQGLLVQTSIGFCKEMAKPIKAMRYSAVRENRANLAAEQIKPEVRARSQVNKEGRPMAPAKLQMATSAKKISMLRAVEALKKDKEHKAALAIKKKADDAAALAKKKADDAAAAIKKQHEAAVAEELKKKAAKLAKLAKKQKADDAAAAIKKAADDAAARAKKKKADAEAAEKAAERQEDAADPEEQGEVDEMVAEVTRLAAQQTKNAPSVAPGAPGNSADDVKKMVAEVAAQQKKSALLKKEVEHYKDAHKPSVVGSATEDGLEFLKEVKVESKLTRTLTQAEATATDTAAAPTKPPTKAATAVTSKDVNTKLAGTLAKAEATATSVFVEVFSSTTASAKPSKPAKDEDEDNADPEEAKEVKEAEAEVKGEKKAEKKAEAEALKNFEVKPYDACCLAHAAPKCFDASIAKCVCKKDPYCCDEGGEWDLQCAGQVEQLQCAACPAEDGDVKTPLPSSTIEQVFLEQQRREKRRVAAGLRKTTRHWNSALERVTRQTRSKDGDTPEADPDSSDPMGAKVDKEGLDWSVFVGEVAASGRRR